MTRRSRARAGWVLAGAVPAAFVGLFFVYPVATVVGRGIAPDALVDVVSDRHLRGVAWFTLWQAAVSTVLTVVLALPGAWALARYRFRGRSLVWAAITVPFVLPTVVVAMAFVTVFGHGGPLAGLGLYPGTGAILVAHAFFNYAVVARTVGSALGQVDARLEDAARSLGASRWRAFREVSLPLVGPSLAAAASIVFLFSFTSFGTVLLLGGPRLATVDVEIWRQTAYFLNLDVAAALTVIQVVAVTLSLVVYGALQERTTAHRTSGWRDPTRRAATNGERAFLGVNLAVMAAFLGFPPLLLLYRSLDAAGGLGLTFYRALGSSRRGSTLFVPPWEAIRNSVAFATAAVVVALVVGGILAALLVHRRGRAARAVDVVAMLPLGTSAVTIGLGFLLAFDAAPFNFRASTWLIPVAHALVAIPFVVRIVVPALRSIDPRLREAAAVLGASPARVWREVDLPLVARPTMVAAGFAFAVSLGEFGATVFLARPDYPTMPVAVFRFLSQPGALNLGQAMAMSTILMLVTASAVFLVERWRGGAASTF